jgi:hypothetical protein
VKRALTFGLGLLWFAFALGFGFFLLQFSFGGHNDGFPIFTLTLFDTGIVLGLVYFFGLATAVLLCFAIGAGLCSRALVGKDVDKKSGANVSAEKITK